MCMSEWICNRIILRLSNTELDMLIGNNINPFDHVGQSICLVNPITFKITSYLSRWKAVYLDDYQFIATHEVHDE